MIAKDIHADTRIIADALNQLPRGELITTTAISDLIGRDIRLTVWHLYAAIRIVERETGAVFGCERGKGYRRLKADELVKIGQTARSRIRRTARKGSRSLAAGVMGINDLSPATTRKVLAEQSSLGLLEHLARDRNLPNISESETRPLPVAVTAREFLNAIGARG